MAGGPSMSYWQAVAYGMAMYAIGYAVAYLTWRRK
jgi:hypothetical protein